MSTFKDYLTESTKSYDYKVKVAGDISDDFASRMETALAKFEVAKMSAGIALDDADRWPWLDEIAANMAKASRASGADDIIFTGCSSLRRRYRDYLLAGIGVPAHFIYLAADRALITQRMAARDGHLMPNSLIDSQFSTLEIPADNEPASHIDISGSMDVVMTRILAAITPLITGN